eukprot:72069-Amphidinium_carterae.1
MSGGGAPPSTITHRAGGTNPACPLCHGPEGNWAHIIWQCPHTPRAEEANRLREQFQLAELPKAWMERWLLDEGMRLTSRLHFGL